MTPLDLAKIKAAAERATPGKWQWWTSNSWRRLRSEKGHGATLSVVEPYASRSDGHPDCIVSQEDMDFIEAAQPTTVLALIGRVERLEGALDQGAAWFTEYAIGHRAKGADEKAMRNEERAAFLRAALSETD